MVTRVHHFSITQSSFNALKNLCVLAIHPTLPPHHFGTTDLFTVSKLLLFSQCHITGIIQHVAFAD